MKRIHTRLLGPLLFLALFQGARAQFDSGSTGAYGPMNITANTTLTMPDDGIFHCTTVNIASGVTLKFARNARNTPVYLLATGDVTISGTIDVSGSAGVLGNVQEAAGGPGGYDGGRPAITGQAVPGDGHGPGGGKSGTSISSGSTSTSADVVGHAAFGTPSIHTRPGNGAAYGNNLLIPLVGGSGGGGTTNVNNNRGVGGGGGGGAILIASNTQVSITANGRIFSRGGTSSGQNFANTTVYGGYGSGGAVRIVAPRIASSSANSVDTSGASAGDGRIRIDALIKEGTFPSNAHLSANMVVFYPDFPELRILEAAGTQIDPASNEPVTILLPLGSPPSQVIKVQARNFKSTANLRVTLTPEYGPRLTYDLDIPNPTGEPTEGTVNVEFPVNQLTRVDVWTR